MALKLIWGKFFNFWEFVHLESYPKNIFSKFGPNRTVSLAWAGQNSFFTTTVGSFEEVIPHNTAVLMFVMDK